MIIKNNLLEYAQAQDNRYLYYGQSETGENIIKCVLIHKNLKNVFLHAIRVENLWLSAALFRACWAGWQSWRGSPAAWGRRSPRPPCWARTGPGRAAPAPNLTHEKFNLKGLSREIDFKNFNKNLQNLAYLRDLAGVWIFYGLQWFYNSKSLFIAVSASLSWLNNG